MSDHPTTEIDPLRVAETEILPVSGRDWNRFSHLGRILKQVLNYQMRQPFALLHGEHGLIDHFPSPANNHHNYDNANNDYPSLKRHSCHSFHSPTTSCWNTLRTVIRRRSPAHFFPPDASPDRNSTTSPSCMT